MKDDICDYEQYGADCDMQYLTSSSYRETCLAMGQTEKEIDAKIKAAIQIYKNKYGK